MLSEEAPRLAQACQTGREKLIVWTLMDPGLQVLERAGLTPAPINW